MKTRFSEDFKIKLLSIMIAFGMWIYVMEELDPIMTRTLNNVPIASITNMSEITEKGLTLSSAEPLTVDIDIRGKRSFVLAYLSSDIKVEGSIQTPSVGENVLELSIPSVNGIEYSFNPRVYSVLLEESVIAEKTLDISSFGTPKEGYIVASVTFNKESVYIEGPRTQVDKVDRVIGSVDTENIDKSFSQRVQLVPIDKNGTPVSGIDINGSYVIADVTIQKTKQVPIHIRMVDEDGGRIELDALKPSVDAVTIVGTDERVDAIEYIETEQIKATEYNILPDKAVPLVSPEGIQLSIQRVGISRIPESEMQYSLGVSKEQIRFLGDEDIEGLREMLPDTIQVQFTSASAYQDQLTSNDVMLYIDNAVAANTYVIRAVIEYPAFDVVIQPAQMSIE